MHVEAHVQHDELHQAARVHQDPEARTLAPAEAREARGRERASELAERGDGDDRSHHQPVVARRHEADLRAHACEREEDGEEEHDDDVFEAMGHFVGEPASAFSASTSATMSRAPLSASATARARRPDRAWVSRARTSRPRVPASTPAWRRLQILGIRRDSWEAYGLRRPGHDRERLCMRLELPRRGGVDRHGPLLRLDLGARDTHSRDLGPHEPDSLGRRGLDGRVRDRGPRDRGPGRAGDRGRVRETAMQSSTRSRVWDWMMPSADANARTTGTRMSEARSTWRSWPARRHSCTGKRSGKDCSDQCTLSCRATQTAAARRPSERSSIEERLEVRRCPTIRCVWSHPGDLKMRAYRAVVRRRRRREGLGSDGASSSGSVGSKGWPKDADGGRARINWWSCRLSCSVMEETENTSPPPGIGLGRSPWLRK